MAIRRGASSQTVHGGLGHVLKAFFLGAFSTATLLGIIVLVRWVLPSVADAGEGIGVRALAKTARTWQTLQGWVGGVLLSGDLVLHQQHLQERLARLEAENLHLQGLAEENRRLRALLRLGQSLQRPFIAAEVIAVGGSNWFRTAIINRGEADGVMPHAPVLNHEGLVGRIGEVRRHHSIVLLLTDRRSAVGVALEKHPGVFGIAKGTGGQHLELLHLSRRVLPREGERLVTSGIGSLFPPGIPVGTIVRVNPSTEPPSCGVRPFADDRNLHEVIVLKPPTPSPVEPTLLPAPPR